MKYKGEISNYTFILNEGVIEVWSNIDSEFPESYIYVKDGEIKNKKDFDYEIMLWFSKNCS